MIDMSNRRMRVQNYYDNVLPPSFWAAKLVEADKADKDDKDELDDDGESEDTDTGAYYDAVDADSRIMTGAYDAAARAGYADFGTVSAFARTIMVGRHKR